MLTVCLHKLCAKDNFANAARNEERCVNKTSGGWKIAPGRVQNGLLEASGGLLGDRWAVKTARKPNLGGSWVRLGRSWRLLGRSGGLPGGLLGPPGALLAAPGVNLGLPGVTFWSFLDLFW